MSVSYHPVFSRTGESAFTNTGVIQRSSGLPGHESDFCLFHENIL